MRIKLMAKQTVYILIGAPGCGKSTYVHSLIKTLGDDFQVISSDNIVEKLAEKHRIRYRQFFELAINNPLRRQHQRLFNQAIKRSKQSSNVIWDLTNLTRTQRDNIKAHYPSAHFIAVTFKTASDHSYLQAINRQRQKQGDKYIPNTVLTEMLKKYQPIASDESYDQIISV
ncbi:ATP-binding protein [Thalassotalea maritima]|uniref:ATP-binding protein n=1 Tax=Thalassotalea maritima TaxID=3242416 RepID=UPI003527AAA7